MGGSESRSRPDKSGNFPLVFADSCTGIENHICEIFKKGLYFWVKHKMASGEGGGGSYYTKTVNQTRDY